MLILNPQRKFLDFFGFFGYFFGVYKDFLSEQLLVRSRRRVSEYRNTSIPIRRLWPLHRRRLWCFATNWANKLAERIR